jgi:hypothetical protein
MLMTPLFQPIYYCMLSQWCTHFSFVLLILQSHFHINGWTYSTSSWCTSCLNFPSHNMPPVLKTYTHDYSYTPNNYFIWTHTTHYLKITNPIECVKTKNPNKQLLLGTLCYLHATGSLCNLNYLGKHLHTYEDNRGCRNQAVKTCSKRRVVQLIVLQLLWQALL